jgi:serine/threonine-protein kinase
MPNKLCRRRSVSAIEWNGRTYRNLPALRINRTRPPKDTAGSATWLAVTFGLLLQGTIHENRTGLEWFLVPVLTTMALGAVSNALGVQFIPTGIRAWWQTGIRDRLWTSRVGAWLARRLGAPAQSRAVGGGVFRATESALGVAAAELFAALPTPYQKQLDELPALVASLGPAR